MPVFAWLASGGFLGWSCGANDASNIFGTAVSSRMVKFSTAAILSSIFIILGGVILGYHGVTRIGKLGSIDALSGAFTASLAAAITVAWLTQYKLPVSTTQAIVGAAMAWSVFSGNGVAWDKLLPIVLSWVTSPLLCGIGSVVLYYVLAFVLHRIKVRLLIMDSCLRYGLLIVGSYGAFTMGANAMGNIVGVFYGTGIFHDIEILGIPFSETRQLSLFGSTAIAIGVITYSRGVMLTVGNGVFPLDSLNAFISVASMAMVLNYFASIGVPVSSSQAIIGSVVGLGLIHGANTLNVKLLGRIVAGWISTPIIAFLVCTFSLYVMKNLFEFTVVAHYNR
ncbi:inorganic phosphate transporter [Deltaproteobacteria bacterium TL4]